MQHATTGLLILFFFEILGLLILNVPIMYQETPVPNIVPVELTLLTLYWLGLPARTIQLHSWSRDMKRSFWWTRWSLFLPWGMEMDAVSIFFKKKCNAHADKEIWYQALARTISERRGWSSRHWWKWNSFLQR